MAIRTTSEAVELIIETDVDISLDPFIETGSALVDWLDEKGAPDYHTDTMLELIERWLSAHFYAIRDPRRSLEAVRGIQEQFAIKVGLGLDQTPYGQQAIILDTSGALDRLNDGKTGKPAMFWMGTLRS